jgi:hypothetical protein
MESTQQTDDAFGAVLTQALRLNPKDQVRLGDLMNRVARVDGGATAPSEVSIEAPAQAPEAVSLQQWLQTLADLAPWQRFQLIEDAIENTEPGTSDGITLEKARRDLLNDTPTLNLRLAVQRATAEHPGRVIVGLIGLVLAVGTLGHSVFRLIF